MTQTDVIDIMRSILRVEAERVAAGVSVGRTHDVSVEDVKRLDDTLETLMAGLKLKGVVYPLHAIAMKYELSSGEYAILQLALMPHHAPELFGAMMSVLGDTRSSPHLTHALKLFGASVQDPEHFRRMLQHRPLLTEQLIGFSSDEVLDPELTISEAVLEWIGLDSGSDE